MNKAFCHHSRLKFLLSRGLEVTEVRRMVFFKNTASLDSWETRITSERATNKASNPQDKNCKNQSLGTFSGTTMENLRNKIHNKPRKVTHTEKMCELQTKRTFTGFKFFVNFGCLAFKNQTVTFEKPMYLGTCVLEFFKSDMYETYYNIWKPHLQGFILHELWLLLV